VKPFIVNYWVRLWALESVNEMSKLQNGLYEADYASVTNMSTVDGGETFFLIS